MTEWEYIRNCQECGEEIFVDNVLPLRTLCDECGEEMKIMVHPEDRERITTTRNKEWSRKENIYYNPEKYDLEVVFELELAKSYAFDTHVIYRHKDGRHFYMHDAGCSCPTPFEDVRFEDMQLVTRENYQDIILRIDRAKMADKIDMMNAVKKSLSV